MPPVNQDTVVQDGFLPVQTTLKGVGGRVLTIGNIAPPVYYRPVAMPSNAGGSIMGAGFMALPPGTTLTDAASSAPAAASYDNQSTAVPASPQWGTGAVLQSVSNPTMGGSGVKSRAIIILGFLLLLAGAFGQSDRSIHVKEFSGLTVGEKVWNAMADCPADGLPCILIVDASLAGYPAGTMPNLCANCSMLDYRSGAAAALSGTRKEVDGYPSTCTTTNGTFNTQLQCAAAMEIDRIKSGAQTANVILEAGNTVYSVCGSVLLADPTFQTRYSVSIVGNAFMGTSIVETCSSATDTVYLPLISGAMAGGYAKQLTLTHLFVNAAKLAPHAIGIYGAHYNSTFADLHYRNGTSGDAVWGVDGNADGWGFEDTFADLRSEYDWTGGSGAVTSVSLSGGVPTITVSNGGSGYSSTAQVWLVGFQNGSSNVPCSSMGTTTPTISGGVITAIATTATGCSGTVYAQVYDGPPIDYGTDLEYETDSRLISGIVDTVGRVAGLRVRHGNNRVIAHHSESRGAWGLEDDNATDIFGENCGEELRGCFYLNGHTGVYGTIVNSTLSAQTYVLFYNNWGAEIFNGVFCGSTVPATEYHTFVSSSGTADNPSDAPLGNNTLAAVSYCGSGGGSTITYEQYRTTQNLTATNGTITTGTTQTLNMDAGAPVINWKNNGTTLWQTLLTGANGDYRILDVHNSNAQRFDLAQSGYTYLSSYGTAPVQINATANSGTGGFSVWSGGASPIYEGGIDGAGNFTGKTHTFTGATPTVSAGQIGIGNTTSAATSCGSLSGAAGCMVVNIGGTAHYLPYY